jgi:hypothetical protein
MILSHNIVFVVSDPNGNEQAKPQATFDKSFAKILKHLEGALATFNYSKIKDDH